MSGDVYTPRYPNSAPADSDAIPSDTPYIPGTLGGLVLAVRNDGAATVLGTVNGNMTPIAVDEHGIVFVTSSAAAPIVVAGPGLQDAAIDNGAWAPVEISLESEAQHTNGSAFNKNVPVSADGDVVRPKGSWYGVQYFCPTDATGGVSYLHNPATIIPAKSLNVFNNAPTKETYNYSTAQGDGTAARATDSTVDFSGPALVSGQLVRIIVFQAGGLIPLVWEQGKNAQLTIAAGGPLGQIITIAEFDGVGAPVPATYTGIVVMWAGPAKQTIPSFTHSTEFGDITAAYATALTLTLSAANASVPTTPQLAEVIVMDSLGIRHRYVNGDGCYMTMSGFILTIAGCVTAPFNVLDTGYIIRWNASPRPVLLTSGVITTNVGAGSVVQIRPGQSSAVSIEAAGNVNVAAVIEGLWNNDWFPLNGYDPLTGKAVGGWAYGQNGNVVVPCSGLTAIRVRGVTVGANPNLNIYMSAGPGTVETYNIAPSAQDGMYCTDKGDAVATYLSGSTITFTGPTITSQQLRKVTVFDPTSGNPNYYEYEQGRNGVQLSISAGVITISGAGATPIPVGASVAVTWAAQEKAYDPTLQANRNEPAFSDRSYRTSTTPTSLIASAQTLTNAWVALGPQMNVDGYKKLRLYLAWTLGTGSDATTYQIQALFWHTAGGTGSPPAVLKVDTSSVPYKIIADDEVVFMCASNAAGKKVFEWDLDNSVGFVQFQVQATTPGSPAGTISVADVTQGY